MNYQELKFELGKIGIKEYEYSINQGLKENALIVEDMGGFWKVFHFERGHEEMLGLFKSQSEALEFLLESFKSET